MKTLVVSKKRSGVYTITPYTDVNWEVVGKVNSPKELKELVNSLPMGKEVIKSEYSQSQLKTMVQKYNEKDALRAFDLKTTKENIENYF